MTLLKLILKKLIYVITFGKITLDLQNPTNTVKLAEKKTMFKEISKKEMMEMLNKTVDDGYVKTVGAEHFSLTNKGKGKFFEYLYDFTDIMMEVEAYKSYPQEYIIQITMESLMQTFGSKLQAFIVMHNTEWKADLKRQLEMPMEELLREMGLDESEVKSYLNKPENKKSKQEVEKEGNVFYFKNKKDDDTVH